MPDSSYWERFQAIGRARGGRTTKIHLLVDEHGRPHGLDLTAGQASDIVAAAELESDSSVLNCLGIPKGLCSDSRCWLEEVGGHGASLFE